MAEASRLLVGVFVGGRGRRMGGVAKGLLKAPDSEATLVQRLLGELTSAAPDAELVLVGDAALYAAYGRRAVADAPGGIGPLGGLLGLLLEAEQAQASTVLALACDLPSLDAALIARLLDEDVAANALVVEQNGVRNPLVARYRVSAALPAARQVMQAGKRSLQAVLDQLADGVHTLPINAAEAAKLDDWDTPEDVRGR
jgi:molybdopterin-guanine dinucleotide biosynthesis protein A